MTDQTTTYQVPTPNPDLAALNRLVGAWEVSGGVQGTVSFEWLEGGFFLMQRFDFDHGGHRVRGIEIIGHEQPFGAPPSADIKSRIYDALGNTFEYTYELIGDTLTIWGGDRGSPAYYRGTFSPDGDSVSGAWVYPDGGGYESAMRRIS